MTPLHAARGLLYTLGAVFWGILGVGSWLFGRRPDLPLPRQDVSRILVVRLDLLGDVVFSLPAVEALAAAFPAAQIDVLVLPYTSAILARVPAVTVLHALDVNVYRRPGGWTQIGTLLATIRRLRAQRYDLAVGLSGLLGGVFAVLSGARWRVGYRDETYWGAYNISVPGRRYQRRQHEVDYCLDLVRAIQGGALPEIPSSAVRELGRWNPVVPLGTVTGVDSSLRGEYAVMVPGASNGAAKRWPSSYWSALGDRLSHDMGLEVVLSGAPSERALGDAVAGRMHRAVANRVGRTDLEELVTLLAGASVVIAGDTGPLHLAAALGAPVIGIFGPTDPANTGPRSPRAAVIRLDLSCSPCYDLRGPADCKLPDQSMPCMWGITPDRVYTAVRELLQARGLPGRSC